MRLTINLDDDLYAVARSLAHSEDSTISAAVNTLVRRGLERRGKPFHRTQHGLPVVRCHRAFTSEDVRALDTELP